MTRAPASVLMSVSSWQQPVPAPVSEERSRLVDEVADRVLTCGEQRLRVGIDGLTASGKTSFGHELAQKISALGRPVLRASLDDFKRRWRERHVYDRESGAGYYRNAFDYETIIRYLLEPAGPMGSGRCVLCSIDPLTQIEHRDAVTEAAVDSVLIVDGVFAFRPQLNASWDFRIWLDVDEQTAVRRGTRRDQGRDNEQIEAVHRDRYLASERIYLSEVDPIRLVDLCIDNTCFHRPRFGRAG